MTADDAIIEALESVARGEDLEQISLVLAQQLRANGFSLEEAVAIGESGYVRLCGLVNSAGETSPYPTAEWEAVACAVYSQPPLAPRPRASATTLDGLACADPVPAAPVIPEPSTPTETTDMTTPARSATAPLGGTDTRKIPAPMKSNGSPVGRAQPSNVVAEITAALEVLCEPGEWHELRTLKGRHVTASGYFNDRELMAKAALQLNQRGSNVYFTLNPVLPELSARSLNHVTERSEYATTDDHIAARRWLLIDVDPKRVSGIASTDEEHNLALAGAGQIRLWLMEEWNWPAPLMMDSGNGAYALCRIMLPNDDPAKQLVKAVLETLAQRFDDDRVTVDISTFNASRVARVPGTMNRKGDDIRERPHRQAEVLDIPWEIE